MIKNQNNDRTLQLALTRTELLKTLLYASYFKHIIKKGMKMNTRKA